MVKTIDISDALFCTTNMSLEEGRRWKLWGDAQDECDKVTHDLPLFEGPLMKYDYTKKIYRWYLEKEGLKYDEGRGL